jgi:hypothetical protein
VARIALRRQLTEEDKEEALADPVHCYPAPLRPLLDASTAPGWADAANAALAAAAASAAGNESPEATHRVTPGELADGMAAAAARIFNFDTEAAGDDGAAAGGGGGGRPFFEEGAAWHALLARDFLLRDALGIWPALRRASRRSGARGAGRHVTRALLLSVARRYHVRCELLDSAAVADGNLQFAHWRATLRRRRHGGGTSAAFAGEGLQLALWEAEPVPAPAPPGSLLVGRGAAGGGPALRLRLRDLLLFRDPFDSERHVLKPRPPPCTMAAPPVPVGPGVSLASGEAMLWEALGRLSHQRHRLSAELAEALTAGAARLGEEAPQAVALLERLRSAWPRRGNDAPAAVATPTPPPPAQPRVEEGEDGGGRSGDGGGGGPALG